MSLLNRDITNRNCRNLIGLSAGHYVFQLDYDRGSLVVKGETRGTTRDFRRAANVMCMVDAHSKAVALNSREIEALNLLAIQFFDQDLTNALQAATSWQKMEVKTDMLTLEEAARNHQQNSDKSDIRYFAAVLNAPGGMEKLGRIAAADAFNGNQDRFSLGRWFGLGQNPNQIYFGGRFEGNDLLCIQNIGNLFIAVKRNAANQLAQQIQPAARLSSSNYEILGLDMFDPQSSYRDATKPVTQVEHETGDQWPGRMLADDAAGMRMEFANDLVEDLEMILGPRNRKVFWGRKARLDKSAAKRFVAGFEEGANTLKNKIAANGRDPANVSLVMMEKLRLLGWVR